MKLFFWQFSFSIHQCALLEALAKTNEITLIVERVFSERRKQQGWNCHPEFSGVKTIVAPDRQTVTAMIRENHSESCVHLVSGINTIFKRDHLIDQMNRCGIKPYIHAEAYHDRDGWRTWVRGVLYRARALKYRSNIAGILAPGRKGVDCYCRCGFCPDRIFEWGYFTMPPESAAGSAKNFQPHDKLRILFVGALIPRKNILALIGAVKKVLPEIECFTIIGHGELDAQVGKMICGETKIKHIAMLPNEQMANFMATYDLLILPSVHDGWGAVVNEALQAGARVLASDNCGAACLLDSPERGSVFPLRGGPNALRNAIEDEITKGIQTAEQHAEVAEWSRGHISGEAAAEYLMCLLNKQKCEAPWHRQ